MLENTVSEIYLNLEAMFKSKKTLFKNNELNSLISDLHLKIKTQELVFTKTKDQMDKDIFTLKTAELQTNELTVYLCDESLEITTSNKVKKVFPPNYYLLFSYKALKLYTRPNSKNTNLFFFFEDKVYYIETIKNKQKVIELKDKKPQSIFLLNNDTSIKLDLKTSDIKNLTVYNSMDQVIGYGLADFKVDSLYYKVKYNTIVLCMYGKQKKIISKKEIESFKKIRKQNNRLKTFLNKIKKEDILLEGNKSVKIDSDIDYLDIIELINLQNKT